jgi:tetratricopeptide (TPR) repeat protein
MAVDRFEGRLAPLTAALIQALSQGNPFFVEELVGTLYESGSIYRHQDGAWRVAEPIVEALRQANCLTSNDQGQLTLIPDAPLSVLNLDLPDSIQGVVLARLDRLSESNRVTLKVASVIGYNFEFDLLSKTHPVQKRKRKLLSYMETLNKRSFTYQETPPPLLAYTFEHNITHDVVYETLLFRQQQELHQAVAKELEDLHPEAIEQLAYHAFKGQDWSRALRYHLLTGQQAQKLFANHEAIDHFEKALHAAEHLPPAETAEQRQAIHAALGELLTTIGQYEKALSHLKQALDISTERSDLSTRARVCRWLARLYESKGEYDPAFDWIEEGIASLAAQETGEVAELLLLAGLINTRQGEYEMAQEQAEKSLYIAGNLGETTVMARSHNLLGHINRLWGNSATAIEHFEQASALYQEANDLNGQALTYNQIANVYLYTSQWSKADKNYRRAQDIFNQTGDIYNLAFVDNNLGEIARNQGRLSEALALYETALQLLEQIGGSPYVLGALHNNLGATFVRQGEIDAARQHLRSSQQYFEQAQARDFLPEMHRLFAEAALAVGELNEAEKQIQQALALAQELGMREEEGNSLRVLGRISMAQKPLEQAEQYLVNSITILDEVGNKYEAARSRLSLARLYAAQQKPDAAAGILKKCMPVFENLGAALDLDEARNLRAGLLA